MIFSHWGYFDQLLNTAVGAEGWNTLQRVSYVWIRNRWVAYPFQNNIAALPKDDQVKERNQRMCAQTHITAAAHCCWHDGLVGVVVVPSNPTGY